MPNKYNTIMVMLHWLVAILVIMALGFGTFILSPTPNTDAKIPLLMVHMSVGLAILGLMIIRILTRITSKTPAKATTGMAMADRIGTATHYLLYIAVIGMCISGLGMAQMADLFSIVYQNSGAPLPESFYAYPPRQGHGLLSKLLFGLIGLHFAAVLFHQFILRDGLLKRMLFGITDDA